MATMVMAITAVAATAMRDVALPRRGDAAVVCDARKRWYAWLMTLAPANCGTFRLHLGCVRGESSVVGLIKKPGGGGAWSAVANTPVP